MKRLLILIAFLVTGICTYAQGKYDDTLAPKVLHVQGNVHTVKGGLGNVALVSNGNEIIMVDTKADTVKRALQKVLEETFPGMRIRYIINTHMHFDHTGGNDFLCNGCNIIAHANAREGINANDTTRPTWPDITFDSVINIYFNDEEIKLKHFPNSHTNHDVVVYFTKSHVLAMGDMYFSGMYPFITDEGSIKNLIKHLTKLINAMPKDVKVIPGHGPVSSIADMTATRDMLVESVEYVQKKIKAGRSESDIIKEGLPKAWDDKWGKGYCKEKCWIETVYSLVANKQ